MNIILNYILRARGCNMMSPYLKLKTSNKPQARYVKG